MYTRKLVILEICIRVRLQVFYFEMNDMLSSTIQDIHKSNIWLLPPIQIWPKVKQSVIESDTIYTHNLSHVNPSYIQNGFWSEY